ncbi:DUF1205 domain-containing protein [Spirillospora sp. NBC_00431]
MKILFLPWAIPPHYYPMVPLIWASRLAGHEVRVAGQKSVAGAIAASGMAAITVGESYDPIKVWDERAPIAAAHFQRKEGGAEPTPEERARLADRIDELMGEPYIRSAEAMSEDLVPFARTWRPDLVVSDPLVMAAPVVAQAIGVPLVHHMDGTLVTPEFGFPGRRLYEGRWAGELSEVYKRYGLEMDGGEAVRKIDPCPDVLQIDGIPNRVPIRYEPYNGSAVAPDWLREPTTRPRVCVTRGITTSQALGTVGDLVPQIIANLADLDVEVVVTVKKADAGLVEATPGKVRVAEELPLNVLLPSCDAIIHQGGTGTMLTAARYGVPQITITKIPGQVANGAALARTGAGLHLHLDSVEQADIKSAAAEALSDGPLRESARRLAERVLAQPSPPAEVAADLESLV